MQWEQLTAADFAAAAKRTGVCVLPLGVLERHSEHLPLGTDMLVAHRLACLAAEQEPAVVFPPFCFGQIYEARCFPGTVTLKPRLLLELLSGVLDEIGRNGFRKIVIFSGHGGNNGLVQFLAQSSLWRQRPYTVYAVRGAGGKETLTPAEARAWDAVLSSRYHGHACECETSISLALHPHLVKMARVPARGGAPLGRMRRVPGSVTGIGWYADHPQHYAGDARAATAAKGAALVRLAARGLARFLRDVKRDRVAPALERQFFRRAARVGKRHD